MKSFHRAFGQALSGSELARGGLCDSDGWGVTMKKAKLLSA